MKVDLVGVELTSECRVLEVATPSTGGSCSSGLVSEDNMGGLMVWVMARAMGRSLSRIFSCTGNNDSTILQRVYIIRKYPSTNYIWSL